MQSHICAGHNGSSHVLLEFELQINIETPTQHERLEAALFLRDWARDKVAPRKLELLLGRV